MSGNLFGAHTNRLDTSTDDFVTVQSADSSSSFGSTFAATTATTTFGGLVSAYAGAVVATAPSLGTTPAGVTDYGTITVKTGAVTFNLDFQYLTADGAPTQAFINDIKAAAGVLSKDVSNTMTLNITIGYGELDGSAVTGGGAVGGDFSLYTESYSAVRSALLAHEPNDPNFAALPNTSSFGGYSTVQLSNAEAKSLGFISATQAGQDGGAGFATDISSSPDALVGVALHELTHAMGRAPFGVPGLFDLFRYTSVGNIFVNSSVPAPSAAYFSIDGGKTALASYGQNSDPSDFLNKSPNANDPFDEIYTPGQTVQGLTKLDLTQLDVLGFNTSAAVATPCFVTGTTIRTLRGDVAVERLVVGDTVVTASGAPRPVAWIGRRMVDLARHPEPSRVYPVRVLAGAFGADLPRRDLWLSPDHALAFEGALIPVARLINGSSVVPIVCERIEYWHVELESHDVLLAEGLPAESYLDTGNRTGFANGGAFIAAHPDFHARAWNETCLPIEHRGPAVVAAKRRLLEELAERGEGVIHEDDAHLIADGRRIDPLGREGGRLEFALDADARDIVLRSRTFVPAQVRAESYDTRQLGLCVGGLAIDGRALDLAALEDTGWNKAEHDSEGAFTHRWTDGEARLPQGARTVVIHLGGLGHYWAPVADMAARVAA